MPAVAIALRGIESERECFVARLKVRKSVVTFWQYMQLWLEIVVVAVVDKEIVSLG
jgi:hypothetical protein